MRWASKEKVYKKDTFIIKKFACLDNFKEVKRREMEKINCSKRLERFLELTGRA